MLQSSKFYKIEIIYKKRIKGFYLEKTLSYLEVRVDKHNEDKVRPKFDCKIVNENMLKPFRGFNRAQASIIEAAILISRLKILPLKKIKKEKRVRLVHETPVSFYS